MAIAELHGTIPCRSWIPPLAAALLLATTGMLAMPAFAGTSSDGGTGFTWNKGLEASIQGAGQTGAFWGLQQVFAPGADYYDTSPAWMELSAKPWVSFEAPVDSWTGYGKASALATGTLGHDVFDQGSSGRIALEEAYLGARGKAAGLEWDFSAGSRDFRLGEGLLLSMGGGNGFERGAPMLAPHRAWQGAVLASVRGRAFGAQAFHLDPDELESSDTHTRLRGMSTDWRPREGATLGTAWFEVTRSRAPYPQAPVTIIDGGRDGLQTWSVFGRWAPGGGQMDGFSAWGEVAVQRNNRINMKAWGGALDVGWRWGGVRWRPRLSWSPRVFSGDDPATPDRLERFDPLYYDGSPSTWSSGANGSFAFYNSNLRVNRVRLELTFDAQNFASLSWYDVRAHRADSPIQYGQTARPAFSDNGVSLISGFPDKRLTRELYLEHTHVFDPHRFLTWGVALAKPRAGIRAIVPDAHTWYGVMVNYSIRF